MLDERELQAIWYGSHPPSLVLRAASRLFAGVSALRRSLYRRRIFPQQKIGAPVVVVGNISVGGTGKTPLVIALVEALRERGWKPAVVSRGFRGAATSVTRVHGSSDPSVVGDEAKLIDEATGVPVFVAHDRPAAARAAVKAGANVIVSDDGLQHYALARDVEICVIDGARRFGNGLPLPAGPLREPISRLRSVDFVVCNGAQVAKGEVPMQLVGDSAVSLAHRETRALSDFQGVRVHAVAGIGNPNRFFDQLRHAGLDIHEERFPDHHDFQKSDLDFGDDAPVLMTEKDAVKCRRFARDNVWSVPVRAMLPDSFVAAVEAKVRAASAD